MFGFTLLLLSRFCCFRGVGLQLRVAVTLATATLDVLTLGCAQVVDLEPVRQLTAHCCDLRAGVVYHILALPQVLPLL